MHQRHLIDTEYIVQQTALLRNVVIGGEDGKTIAVVGRLRVGARRGRQAIAEHVGDDDEPARRVQRLSGADQPFGIGMFGPVRGGVDDDIAFVAVQFTVAAPDDLRIGQGDSALQADPAALKDAVVDGVVDGSLLGSRATVTRSAGLTSGPGAAQATIPQACAVAGRRLRQSDRYWQGRSKGIQSAGPRIRVGSGACSTPGELIQ